MPESQHPPNTPPGSAQSTHSAPAEGADAYVARILERASDLSSESDELTAAVRDWPSRCQLSSQCKDILIPLRIGQRHHVLEVGAGSGPLTRYLGERAGRVVALERDAERARSAAKRCAGLAGVEVRVGSLEALEAGERFDLIVLAAATELLGGTAGQGSGLLELVRSRLREQGALVVAIENQFGLKYLLGYAEDRLGLPLVGLEGYPGRPASRTYARRTLSSMLAAAGLEAQRWLYPFPDHRLPRVILSDELFERANAPELAGALVRLPIQDFTSGPVALLDERAMLGELLAAGLLPETSNSFLVLAGKDAAAVACWLEPGTLAWLLDGDRRKRWRRRRRLMETPGGLELRSARVDPTLPARDGWLSQECPELEVFAGTSSLNDLLRRACREENHNEIRRVLGLWHATVRAALLPAGGQGDRENPFRSPDTTEILPPALFDLHLSNFVLTGSEVRWIDCEWQLDGGVDAQLAQLRALWYFAVGVVLERCHHPWRQDSTVDDLMGELADLVGLPWSDSHRERLLAAEAAVLAKVGHESAARILARYHGFALTRQVSGRDGVYRAIRERDRDHAELERVVSELGRQLEQQAQDMRTLASEKERLAEERRSAAAALAEAQRSAAESRTETDLLRARGAELAERVEVAQRVLRDLSASRSYRLGRVLTWPARALVRLLR